MPFPFALARPRPLAAQLSVVALATGLLILPATSSATLLVPLTSAARHDVARRALAEGALILGPGPVAGSIVVRSDRSGLAQRMLRAAVLAVPAAAVGCGSQAGAAA